MASNMDQLFAQHIEHNPDHPGPAEARLIGYGVPIWALVGYLNAVNGDVRRVALDYDLPQEAVLAALLYYQEYKALIDARIAANEAPDGNGTPVVLSTA